LVYYKDKPQKYPIVLLKTIYQLLNSKYWYFTTTGRLYAWTFSISYLLL